MDPGFLIQEDQEVFFESLETIPSSASSESESGGEENRQLRSLRASMAKTSVIESQSSSYSRYEVWTHSSGSVFERRQRLLTQMGLLASQVGPDNLADTASVVDGTLEASNSRSTQKPPKIKNGVSYSEIHESNFNFRKDRHGEIEGNTSGSVNASKVEITSTRLFLSSECSSSSSTTHGNDDLSNANEALSRSASCGYNVLKDRQNSKVSKNLDDTNVDRGNVLTRERSASFDHEHNRSLHESENGDVVYRIKDLDSGKEFVVDEIGESGLWNKVKELHTGKELTLEEFESALGLPSVVQDIMKRSNLESDNQLALTDKKKKAWIKVFKGMVKGTKHKGHAKTASAEKPGRKGGSASHEGSRDSSSHQTPKRIKVHSHKKSSKDFSELYLRQEIQAHDGAIWTMKFSFDGSLLATAGEDKIVRIWEVVELSGGLKYAVDILEESCSSLDKHCSDDFLTRQSSDNLNGASKHMEAAGRQLFLSETSKFALYGHKEGVLDVAWSHSQKSLLSCSLDNTVRLWNASSGECLRVFAHNDSVTCIHFNPIDDGYFISGSVDGKVRVWSITERQVVDWVDLNETVTAACYTPNGEGAVVGSDKGTCRLYKMSDNKLQFDGMFEAQRKKKKRSEGKEITGIQFVPGDNSKILVSSSDSRIRVYEGTMMMLKYKGLRNKSRPTSASFSSNGMYIISASEDSRVCIWNYDTSPGFSVHHKKALSVSYEDFCAPDVLIAIPWPGLSSKSDHPKLDGDSSVILQDFSNTGDNTVVYLSAKKPVKGDPASGYDISLQSDIIKDIDNSEVQHHGKYSNTKERSSPVLSAINFTSSILDRYLEDCSVLSKSTSNSQSGSYGFFSDGKGSATWPEENLPTLKQGNPGDFGTALGTESLSSNKVAGVSAACGLVIVTAGLGGVIQIFQNQS